MNNINYNIIKVHKNDIKHGDTIMFNGQLKTVSHNDIKHSDFMGTTIFGDSYKLGYELVDKVVIL